MTRSTSRAIAIAAVSLAVAIGVAPAGSAAGPARVAGVAPGDWSQGRFDAAHSGTNPFEQVLGRETVPGLHPVWRAKTGAEGFLGIGSSPPSWTAWCTREPCEASSPSTRSPGPTSGRR